MYIIIKKKEKYPLADETIKRTVTRNAAIEGWLGSYKAGKTP